MEPKDYKLQAAIALLSYHAQMFPPVVLMPEFAQIKEREKALLYASTVGINLQQARSLYINSVIELHEAIEDMTPEEREKLNNFTTSKVMFV